MKRHLGWVAASVMLSGVAWGDVDAFNPGSAESPPGPGCAIGTSGCFPSSPPGPVSQPADPGATSFTPPPVVDPQNVPFFGSLPGPAGDLQGQVVLPEVAWQQRDQEERANQQQVRALLEKQTSELELQREQLKAQTEEMAAQREELRALQEQQPPAEPAPEAAGGATNTR